jgi:DNA-binding transcriptional ArsR family regulator
MLRYRPKHRRCDAAQNYPMTTEQVMTNGMFAEIAALAGDPARASMLQALMGGRALTAGELANAAGIAPQTASGHLARMTTAGLIAFVKQGRHRYHRLASPAVAVMMESIMQVACDVQLPSKRLMIGPKDEALRTARICYDHLAGVFGVALADALIASGYADLSNEVGVFTDSGLAFLSRLGINAGLPATSGRGPARALCRACLDWSERRPHVGGAVGAAICRHSIENGWVRRRDGTRAVSITPKGQWIFREEFGVRLLPIAKELRSPC